MKKTPARKKITTWHEKKGPYALPKGWKWVRLEDVGKIFAGSSAPQNKKYFINGKYPFYRVSDLGRYKKTDNLVDVKDYINDIAIKEKRLVKVKQGTIIFPKSGAAILTNNKGIIGEDGYLVSHLAAIECLPNINNKFIYYVLYNLDLSKIIKNDAYPSLKLEQIKQIKTPIPFKNNKPDIETQKQIVAKIEEIFSRVDKAIKLREEALNKTEKLFQMVLDEVFIEAKEDKEGWKWIRLEEICDFLRGPFGSSIKKSVCVSEGYKLYEQGNVINKDFKRGKYYITEEKFQELKKFEVVPGDLLFTCAGTLGKVAIVPNNIERGIINSVLMRVRIKNKEEVYNQFISKIIEIPSVQKRMFGNSKGSSIKNVRPTKIIKQIKIPLPFKNNKPDIETQKQIVERLDKLNEKIKKMKELQQIELEKLKKLKEQVLYKAFRGQLI